MTRVVAVACPAVLEGACLEACLGASTSAAAVVVVEEAVCRKASAAEEEGAVEVVGEAVAVEVVVGVQVAALML